jgi:hypothetical protein
MKNQHRKTTIARTIPKTLAPQMKRAIIDLWQLGLNEPALARTVCATISNMKSVGKTNAPDEASADCVHDLMVSPREAKAIRALLYILRDGLPAQRSAMYKLVTYFASEARKWYSRESRATVKPAPALKSKGGVK